jgi:hypothetical protein
MHVNDLRYSRRAAAVLILSSDPLGAALVGAAVELAGFRVEFLVPHETVHAALGRVRPAHVLVDASDPAARDESVWGPAMMTGARLYLFGGPASIAERRLDVDRYRARTITMPGDAARLKEILTRRPSPVPETIPTD